ncbi:hypothetical protein C8R43DRAFT_942714 [Mycena crocata]|nr:hypothetical protein C8R43DRAFT_942714 [Mycena crocata]
MSSNDVRPGVFFPYDAENAAISQSAGSRSNQAVKKKRPYVVKAVDKAGYALSLPTTTAKDVREGLYQPPRNMTLSEWYPYVLHHIGKKPSRKSTPSPDIFDRLHRTPIKVECDRSKTPSFDLRSGWVYIGPEEVWVPVKDIKIYSEPRFPIESLPEPEHVDEMQAGLFPRDGTSHHGGSPSTLPRGFPLYAPHHPPAAHYGQPPAMQQHHPTTMFGQGAYTPSVPWGPQPQVPSQGGGYLLPIMQPPHSQGYRPHPRSRQQGFQPPLPPQSAGYPAMQQPATASFPQEQPWTPKGNRGGEARSGWDTGARPSALEDLPASNAGHPPYAELSGRHAGQPADTYSPPPRSVWDTDSVSSALPAINPPYAELSGRHAGQPANMYSPPPPPRPRGSTAIHRGSAPPQYPPPNHHWEQTFPQQSQSPQAWLQASPQAFPGPPQQGASGGSGWHTGPASPQALPGPPQQGASGGSGWHTGPAPSASFSSVRPQQGRGGREGGHSKPDHRRRDY